MQQNDETKKGLHRYVEIHVYHLKNVSRVSHEQNLISECAYSYR